MEVARTASVVVVVVVGSLVVVGVAKDSVDVKAEAALVAPPLIRRAGKPCADVDVTMNVYAAVVRGVAAPMAPLLRRW